VFVAAGAVVLVAMTSAIAKRLLEVRRFRVQECGIEPGNLGPVAVTEDEFAELNYWWRRPWELTGDEPPPLAQMFGMELSVVDKLPDSPKSAHEGLNHATRLIALDGKPEGHTG